MVFYIRNIILLGSTTKKTLLTWDSNIEPFKSGSGGCRSWDVWGSFLADLSLFWESSRIAMKHLNGILEYVNISYIKLSHTVMYHNILVQLYYPTL